MTDTLNIATRFIENLKSKNYGDTTITEHNHEPKTFYCLTVPTGAFVVRYNGKESVTGNCHALAGAASFRLAIHEMLADKLITQEQYDKLIKKIYSVARTLRKHEHQINKMLFSKGNVEGINTKQLNIFVDSRINLCLENLGLKPIFKVNDKKNVIAKWFYKNISMPTIHDFFVNLGSQYNRNYSPEKFTVPTHYKFRG